MRGKHILAHWASTETTIAVSVAEAELNATVKGVVEVIGLSNIMRAVDMNTEHTEVKKDSSSAKGIAMRSGCGNVKHLEVRQLWIQEVVRNKAIKMVKVPRAMNPSDSLTHH